MTVKEEEEKEEEFTTHVPNKLIVEDTGSPVFTSGLILKLEMKASKEKKKVRKLRRNNKTETERQKGE